MIPLFQRSTFPHPGESCPNRSVFYVFYFKMHLNLYVINLFLALVFYALFVGFIPNIYHQLHFHISFHQRYYFLNANPSACWTTSQITCFLRAPRSSNRRKFYLPPFRIR